MGEDSVHVVPLEMVQFELGNDVAGEPLADAVGNGDILRDFGFRVGELRRHIGAIRQAGRHEPVIPVIVPDPV